MSNSATMQKQLLYSVYEIFSNEEFLKLHVKTHFNIPLYQRGYKWEPENLSKLLDDIHNFQHSGSKFYCLQNITIVPFGPVFNVVDGQQRLTTLCLILSYLGKAVLVKDKVRFPDNSIRSHTNALLNDYICAGRTELLESSWGEICAKDKNFDHQDLYHMYRIWHAIQLWFKEKDKKSTADFLDKLLHHTKFIVNLVTSSESEEKIFSNLNSKRIPLDGSDLIRALLITKVALEEGQKESDIKNIVRVNEKRVRIGWELDEINHWWSRKDVREYFTKIIGKSIRSASLGQQKQFDEFSYPINRLYLLFAYSEGSQALDLNFIEQFSGGALKLYHAITRFHNTLIDWFTDHQTYHYIGFLATQGANWDFKLIWDRWTTCPSKKEFQDFLRSEMRKSILVEGEMPVLLDKKGAEKINWYSDRSSILIRILIMMDIINVSREPKTFMPITTFQKSGNDIEHIFPRNPREAKEQIEYIRFLNRHVVEEKLCGEDIEPFDLSSAEELKDDQGFQQQMSDFIKSVIRFFSINSPGNLVLLHGPLNKQLSNKPYAVKRHRVIEFMNQGNYVQPHSFRVFARYFNGEKDIHAEYQHWTEQDILNNATYISKSINQFFAPHD